MLNLLIFFSLSVCGCALQVDSFESQADEESAAKMFERWMVNEADMATPENLLYTLEGLKLTGLVEGIF